MSVVGDRSVRQVLQIKDRYRSDVLFTKVFTVKLVLLRAMYVWVVKVYTTYSICVILTIHVAKARLMLIHPFDIRLPLSVAPCVRTPPIEN